MFKLKVKLKHNGGYIHLLLYTTHTDGYIHALALYTTHTGGYIHLLLYAIHNGGYIHLLLYTTNNEGYICTLPTMYTPILCCIYTYIYKMLFLIFISVLLQAPNPLAPPWR